MDTIKSTAASADLSDGVTAGATVNRRKREKKKSQNERGNQMRDCAGRVKINTHQTDACFNDTKYEHEGKRYCFWHYPPNVEARKGSARARAKLELKARWCDEFAKELDIRASGSSLMVEHYRTELAKLEGKK